MKSTKTELVKQLGHKVSSKNEPGASSDNINNSKGFTLVELIVVIVILAILAAIAVPALTGYIDKAKMSSLEPKAREAMIAMETLANEQYAYFGNPVQTALVGTTYEPDTDYVAVKRDGTTGTYKAYPVEVNSAGAIVYPNAKGYLEYLTLSSIPATFYQPVKNYWNTGPCAVLDADGKMLGFRTFDFVGDKLYAMTYGINLYDTNGNWFEVLDGSGWRKYSVDLTTDAITPMG